MICTTCKTEFERKPRSRPDQEYCSKRCKNKGYYQNKMASLHKPRIKSDPEKQQEHKREYQKRYYREVSRQPMRWRQILARGRAYRKNLGEAYKAYQRERWHRLYNLSPVIHPEIVITTPYTGHQWMEKIRAMAGPAPDQSAPWADKYNDMVGEGVLALLEGRDPVEAMDRMRKDYNRQEYRQVYFSDMESNSSGEADDNWQRRLPHADLYRGVPEYLNDVVEPPEPSEGLSGPIAFEVAPRFKWKKNKARRLHAENHKGSRGPKRSYTKFRGHKGDHRERKYYE